MHIIYTPPMGNNQSKMLPYEEPSPSVPDLPTDIIIKIIGLARHLHQKDTLTYYLDRPFALIGKQPLPTASRRPYFFRWREEWEDIRCIVVGRHFHKWVECNSGWQTLTGMRGAGRDDGWLGFCEHIAMTDYKSILDEIRLEKINKDLIIVEKYDTPQTDDEDDY